MIGKQRGHCAIKALVKAVGFASGGRFLRAVSGKADLRITQDSIRASDLMTEACSKLDRDLTSEEWATYLGMIPYSRSCQQLNPAIAGNRK
jgi:hypothetical protein